MRRAGRAGGAACGLCAARAVRGAAVLRCCFAAVLRCWPAGADDASGRDVSLAVVCLAVGTTLALTSSAAQTIALSRTLA